ncbi:MAG TPA: ComEA family DNA-binding protein [Patescibacteria group bacterium]|nr:ComEA family DNA-binding protein [Patescibacteria group bacterium]
MWQTKPWLITVVLAGAIMLVGGLVWLSFSGQKQEEAGIELVQSGGVGGEIYVDVGGEVENPGLYQLSAGARVNDALSAAGGLSLEADRDWVEQTLNLAAKVNDGDKLFIPAVQESTDESTGGTQAATDKINLNTASAAELDTLYGVGPATANKIIDGRPYAKTEDLLAKKVVSQSVFDRIKDEISVY